MLDQLYYSSQQVEKGQVQYNICLVITELSVSNYMYTYQNFFPDIWESLNLK